MKKPISVLIADDEKLARDAIRLYLNDNTSFTLVAECEDGATAKAAIEQLQPDVILVDIEMPELSGIELVSQLQPPLPHIVFITAFADYAVKAFEENAVDYILKPFNSERFEKMLERVMHSVRNEPPRLPDAWSAFLSVLNQNPSGKFLKRITSKQKGKITFIPVEEIVWVESQGSFSKLHLSTKLELTNFSMKQLEEMLDPQQFVRIHKSHMVNVDHIQAIEPYFHGEYMIKMNNEAELKLSRGYKDNLDRIINQYK